MPMYRETSEVSPVLALITPTSGVLRFDSAPRTQTIHTHTDRNLTSVCLEKLTFDELCLDPYGGMIPPPQGMFDELC